MYRKHIIDSIIDLEGSSFNPKAVMYLSDKELVDYIVGIANYYKDELECLK